MSSHPFPTALLLCLAAALPACQSDRPSGDPAAGSAQGASASSDSARATPVTVTATDYKLELPSSVPAGAVTLQLVNHGKELHQAQIVRLKDGKTAADVAQALKTEGPPPPWMEFMGGPNGIAPGQETVSTAQLAPGQYALLCLIPSPDGVPHIAKGMIQPFEVAASGNASAMPVASDTIRLADYSFESSRPLTPGRHTILVTNDGPQPHELVVLKLAPGKTVEDFAAWATTGGMKGPPPALPLGGVGVIGSGADGVFTADLAAGDYGLICFVPDAKDGKLHLAHGMIKQIRVG
ncbi:MAG TPA: hypothetical protein VMY76_15130 [Gemmatimonadales bacterium]|nr:hypothetical protein [Gemmatimonadales bacterium]